MALKEREEFQRFKKPRSNFNKEKYETRKKAIKKDNKEDKRGGIHNIEAKGI